MEIKATSLDTLARYLAQVAEAAKLARDLRGRYLGTVSGVVVDVNDPQSLGRVLITVDNCPDRTTQWIPVNNCPSTGKQPQSLVGAKVIVGAKSGNPAELAVLSIDGGDPSYITRLALYAENELPPCSEANRGYQALVNVGENDYTVTCLLRDGEYLWVAPSDLAHIHYRGDRTEQLPDSNNDLEMPIENNDLVALDLVSNTTKKQYDRNSKNFETVPQHFGGF